MFVCPWVEASESHSPPELRQQTERKQEPGTKRERERDTQTTSVRDTHKHKPAVKTDLQQTKHNSFSFR